jgi:multidrug resistance efflux pump
LEKKLEVAQKLYESARSISKDDLDMLRLELLQIVGRLDQLNAQKSREEVEYKISQQELALRRLYAPSDGVITKSPLKTGEWAKAGEPLLQLVDVHNLYIKFNIPLRLVQRLVMGLDLKISVDNQLYNGKVKYIAPVADPASGLIEIKVSIDNSEQKIRPGSKGSVELKQIL